MTMNTWPDALAGFDADLEERGKRSQTIATYVQCVEWLRDGTKHGPWDVDTTEIAGWVSERSWSKATYRKVFVALRAFYRWGISAGHCGRSPLVGLAIATPRCPGPQKGTPTPSWVEPIDAFLRHLQAGGLAVRTVDQYRQRVTMLSHCFADPWAVTTRDLEDYLSRPDWSANYRHAGRTVFQRFYRWAAREAFVKVDPAAPLQTIRVSRALPRPTPTDALLEALHRADARTRLVMELALYAGLRISELAQLKVTDITADQLVIHGKGGKQRIIPIHPELNKTLRAELSRRREVGTDSPWLFPSPYEGHLTALHLSNRVTECFGGSWTTHTLRHRFASQAYAATLDIRAVQELLGHAAPETTAVYVAVPNGARTAAVAGVSVL